MNKQVKIILKKQNDKNEIYEEVVEDDEDITKLNLSNKNIIEIPKGLEQFKFLKELYLYNNQISKIQFLTVDAKPFNKNHLINLTNLYLENNKITKIENLNNLINLNTLYLYKNQINKIENLNNLINLTYLLLQKNQITKIENIDNLINLKKLDLSNNQITKIENLDNNINLQELYLNDNQISKIENIHHLSKLKYFWLFNSNQSENIEECKQISIDNYNLELKEIQIQEELLKQQKQQKEKENFDKHFKEIHQQFVNSIKSNDNDLLI